MTLPKTSASGSSQPVDLVRIPHDLDGELILSGEVDFRFELSRQLYQAFQIGFERLAPLFRSWHDHWLLRRELRLRRRMLPSLDAAA